MCLKILMLAALAVLAVYSLKFKEASALHACKSPHAKPRSR